MSMREMIVPKSLAAQRTKAKMLPGAKLTMRRRRSRIVSSALAAEADPVLDRFSTQVSSTWVSVIGRVRDRHEGRRARGLRRRS